MVINENINLYEDYVSFEIAKLLKENGFNCESFASIKVFRGHRYEINGELITPKEDTIIPTLQMAMKWLREVHKLAINIEFQIDFPTWKWRIYHIEPSADKHTNFKHYDTYEEACEAAIKYCLENLI